MWNPYVLHCYYKQSIPQHTALARFNKLLKEMVQEYLMLQYCVVKLSAFAEHMKAEKSDHNKCICIVCNEYTYTKCTICKVAIHYFPKKANTKAKIVF